MEFLPEICGSYGPYMDFSTENATNTVHIWAFKRKNDPRFPTSNFVFFIKFLNFEFLDQLSFQKPMYGPY